VELKATPSDDAEIKWYAESAESSDEIVLHTGNTFTDTVEETKSYYAQAVIGNCVSSRTAVVAEVTPKPVINPLSSNTSTCSGNTVQLSVSATPATAYQWLKSNVSVGNSGSTTNYTTVALTEGATYSVEVFNGSSCSVTSDEVLVTVNPLPVATVADVGICSGAQAILTATLVSGTTDNMTYTWNYFGTSGTGTTNSFTTPQALTEATTYSVRLRNSNGCVGNVSNVANITLNSSFTIIGPVGMAYCVEESVSPTLTVSTSGTTGAITYEWWTDSGTGTDAKVAACGNSPTCSPGEITAERTEFWVRVTNSDCTKPSERAVITLAKNASAGKIKVDDGNACVLSPGRIGAQIN
jgi:hypothetical protein